MDGRLDNDLLIALHAVKEGALDRDDLPRLLASIDRWQKGGLEVSAAEVLSREFRIDPALVRRWESKVSGTASRRIGKYQLKRRVGQGGMGVVFEAEHPNLDRSVALKILSPALGREPAAIQGFLREVKSAGRFNHPNIVHAYDAGIDGDLPYLVMEFVDGENLLQVFQRTGRLRVKQATRWLLEAVRALSILESTGWIHGDGKPSNWIVDDHGALKMADLGLCRPPGVPRPGETLMGSPPYVAPEQLAGQHRIDIRADLYSLGATFYHLLSGRPPFAARSVAELSRALKTTKPEPLAELRPDLPEGLAACIMQLIERSPSARPQSTHDLLEELEPIARAVGVDADEASRAIPDVGDIKRGSSRTTQLLWIAIAACSLLIIGVLAVHLFRVWSEDPADPATTGPPPGPSVEEPKVDTVTPPPNPLVGWEELWGADPRDYAAIFRWLETDEARASTSWSERSSAALAALEGDAGPPWQARRTEVLQIAAERRFTEALATLARFPVRWRVGRFRAEYDELRTRFRGLRDETFANYERRMRAAHERGDVLTMRRVWREVASEPAADVEGYRSRLHEIVGGYPWVSDAVEETTRQRAANKARIDAIRARLASGVIPEPEFMAGRPPEVEAALVFLATLPELTTASPVARRRQLLSAGAFEQSDPSVLAALLALLEPEKGKLPPIDREVEAAKVVSRADAACERWDLEAARAFWGQLEGPSLAGTAAVERTLPTLGDTRLRLERGVFLRGAAFAGKVTGRFLEPSRFTYPADIDGFTHDWAAKHDRWVVRSGVRFANGREHSYLRHVAPFVDAPRIIIEVQLPAEPWRFYVTFGGETVGFARRTSGELLVVSGALPDVRRSLESGAGFWPAGATAFAAERPRFEIQFGTDVITLTTRGGKLTFPALTVREFGWFELLVPREFGVREVIVEGEVEPRWLDARRAVW